MSKLRSISGFPEWLPEQKLVEDQIIATIKGIYANFGFVPIETPAVELLYTLTSKGEVDKEIYALKRLHGGDAGEDFELGLHFDLTVPLARYVAQHYSALNFPFRRYQLQKVWRGERPQKGRFREFYQFDADIIARDTLPLSCDAEVVTILEQVFSTLNIGPFQLRLNNRKILQGLYRDFGCTEAERKQCITAVDKIDKIGPSGVRKELVERVGLKSDVAERILQVSNLKLLARDAASGLRGLAKNEEELFSEGAGEILQVLSLIPENALENIVVDLSLARGLDYYTGLVVEVYLTNYPQFGAVASGGRYDNLASEFISTKLPGVGVSCGLTRLMDLIFTENLAPVPRQSLTKVLVAVNSEAQRQLCNSVASKIRAHDVAAEVYYLSPKLGKQIDYAAKKGIPYMVFLSDDGTRIEAKNLETKTQSPISDINQWCLELKKS